jgi:hypothetical protein
LRQQLLQIQKRAAKYLHVPNTAPSPLPASAEQLCDLPVCGMGNGNIGSQKVMVRGSNYNEQQQSIQSRSENVNPSITTHCPPNASSSIQRRSTKNEHILQPCNTTSPAMMGNANMCRSSPRCVDPCSLQHVRREDDNEPTYIVSRICARRPDRVPHYAQHTTASAIKDNSHRSHSTHSVHTGTSWPLCNGAHDDINWIPSSNISYNHQSYLRSLSGSETLHDAHGCMHIEDNGQHQLIRGFSTICPSLHKQARNSFRLAKNVQDQSTHQCRTTSPFHHVPIHTCPECADISTRPNSQSRSHYPDSHRIHCQRSHSQPTRRSWHT